MLTTLFSQIAGEKQLITIRTRLNMLFSPTLPAKTIQKVMLKRKMLSNRNANGKASGGQVMLMPSIVNAKQC